jgi:hypothetical protein
MIGSARVAALAALALTTACGGPGPGRAAVATPEIVFNRSAGGAATVDVMGVPSEILAALAASAPSPEEWVAILRVSVDGTAEEMAGRPAVLGEYSVADGRIRFRPQYPFDPGRHYKVRFDPSRLTGPVGGPSVGPRHAIETVVSEPAPDRASSTRVAHVYPTAEEIPENHLRMYIQFSSPMGFESGRRHIRLLDGEGREVEGALLPLDVGLWNADRTRYTLLFDPGRVKRGIAPNEEDGRALIKGQRYTLVIDRGWADGRGGPLVEAFRREFRVGAPAERALDPKEWRLGPPAGGTRDPLVVTFPRPLDYALLHRALVVATAEGGPVEGRIEVDEAETRWRFVPASAWNVGRYRLVALAALEDSSGNRVGRAFEVPTDQAGHKSGGEGGSLEFTVTAARERR